jgi:signal transduction histidine kinase
MAPAINADSFSGQELATLAGKNIVWAVGPSSARAQDPILTSDGRKNIGLIDFLRDDDGVIRRTLNKKSEYASFVDSLAQLIKTPSATQEAQLDVSALKLINYRTGVAQLQVISLQDVLTKSIPTSFLKDAIVLISADINSGTQYLTPFGSGSRAQIVANTLDSTLSKTFIKRLPNWIYAIGFLALAVLCGVIISLYPASIAILGLFWLATFLLALSIWLFDVYSIWVPALSTSMLIATSWVIFIGYRAQKIEQKVWSLQNEKQAQFELEQLKNNFVSLISHDLKTPIAKIQAITDRLIHRGDWRIEQREIESLQSSTEELNKYIQSVLQLLRVESSEFKLNKEIVDLNELIEKARLQVLPLAQKKRIEVNLNLAPLFSVEIDPILIQEVCLNLIENAIKYSPEDSTVTVESLEVEDGVVCKVSDQGHGISEADLPKIWHKFVRGKDQDLKTKGTGLGLYLVKYFIELHGGSIEAQSTLNVGTSIQFKLPFEEEKL